MGDHEVQRDHGSVAIEAVLVVPVIMVILFLVVQFALWAHAAQVAQLAASEGDRSAQSVGGSPAAGVSRAQSVLQGPGSDLASSGVVVAVLPGDPGAHHGHRSSSHHPSGPVPAGVRRAGRAYPGVPGVRMSRGKLRDDRGSLTVELVVVTPVLFAIALTVIVFGRISEAHQQVIEASRAAAEAAAVEPDCGQRTIGRF